MMIEEQQRAFDAPVMSTDWKRCMDDGGGRGGTETTARSTKYNGLLGARGMACNNIHSTAEC